jgi:hypothetical protein
VGRHTRFQLWSLVCPYNTSSGQPSALLWLEICPLPCWPLDLNLKTKPALLTMSCTQLPKIAHRPYEFSSSYCS